MSELREELLTYEQLIDLKEQWERMGARLIAKLVNEHFALLTSPVAPPPPASLVYEALVCAEYALTHPQSDQQFALKAIQSALTPSSVMCCFFCANFHTFESDKKCICSCHAQPPLAPGEQSRIIAAIASKPLYPDERQREIENSAPAVQQFQREMLEAFGGKPVQERESDDGAAIVRQLHGLQGFDAWAKHIDAALAAAAKQAIREHNYFYQNPLGNEKAGHYWCLCGWAGPDRASYWEHLAAAQPEQQKP